MPDKMEDPVKVAKKIASKFDIPLAQVARIMQAYPLEKKYKPQIVQDLAKVWDEVQAARRKQVLKALDNSFPF